MGRARRLCGLRAVESARSRRVAARLRPDLALQAARIPDGRRLPARSRACPGAAASPLVRRRRRRRRQRAGRLAHAGRRRGRVRGRHGELSRAPGRRARAAVPRGDRDRHDPHARPLPDRVAARRAGFATARDGRPRGADPRAADDVRAWRDDRLQLPASGRTARGHQHRRRARRRARDLPAHRLLLQPRCGRARLRHPARSARSCGRSRRLRATTSAHSASRAAAPFVSRSGCRPPSATSTGSCTSRRRSAKGVPSIRERSTVPHERIVSARSSRTTLPSSAAAGDVPSVS